MVFILGYTAFLEMYQTLYKSGNYSKMIKVCLERKFVERNFLYDIVSKMNFTTNHYLKYVKYNYRELIVKDIFRLEDETFIAMKKHLYEKI